VGRYQLFQGKFVEIDSVNNTTHEHTGLFLLDTITGEVKQYVVVSYGEGVVSTGWNNTIIDSYDRSKIFKKND